MAFRTGEDYRSANVSHHYGGGVLHLHSHPNVQSLKRIPSNTARCWSYKEIKYPLADWHPGVCSKTMHAKETRQPTPTMSTEAVSPLSHEAPNNEAYEPQIGISRPFFPENKSL